MWQVHEDLTSLASLLESTRQKLRTFELKVKEGESKLSHKKLIQSKTTYLIGQETSEIRRRGRETIAKAREIVSEIGVATSNPDFLDDQTLETLDRVLEAEKARKVSAKNAESKLKISRELECNIWWLFFDYKIKNLKVKVVLFRNSKTNSINNLFDTFMCLDSRYTWLS